MSVRLMSFGSTESRGHVVRSIGPPIVKDPKCPAIAEPSKVVVDTDRRSLDVELDRRRRGHEIAGGYWLFGERTESHVVVFELHRPVRDEHPFDAGPSEPAGTIKAAGCRAGERASKPVICIVFVASEGCAAFAVDEDVI